MVTMQCAIDRIEDGVAICIDDEGKVFDLPFYFKSIIFLLLPVLLMRKQEQRDVK